MFSFTAGFICMWNIQNKKMKSNEHQADSRAMFAAGAQCQKLESLNDWSM